MAGAPARFIYIPLLSKAPVQKIQPSEGEFEIIRINSKLCVGEAGLESQSHKKNNLCSPASRNFCRSGPGSEKIISAARLREEEISADPVLALKK
jgi:hypothetical protein